MIKELACAAACILAVAAAQAGPPADSKLIVPPSPFTDRHGVYDSGSQCWLWDASQATAMKYIFDPRLQVDRNCGGAILEGQARVSWLSGHHASEVWDGAFTAGKFTGNSTLVFSAGTWQANYVDGVRNGASVTHFRDGGLTEENLVSGLRDGLYREVYADGSNRQGRYEKGRSVMVKTCYRDGSCDTAGTHTAPDGNAVKGVFALARVDRSTLPPLVYPPISQRLGEEGTISISIQIDPDGTAHDLRIVRGSGFERLDQAAMAWMASAHFLPATLDGAPVAGQLIMPVRYHLQEPP